MHKSILEELRKIHPDVIKDYFKTGNSNVLNDDLKDCIDKLNIAIGLYEHCSSITEAARRLNFIYFDISIHTCRKIIYDAISFFNLDINVKAEVWCNLYADYFDELGMIVEDLKNWEEARLCYREALNFRLKAIEFYVDPELLQPKKQLIKPFIPPEEMGHTQSVEEIWAETKEFIEGLKIHPKDKARIKKEARLCLGIYNNQEKD